MFGVTKEAIKHTINAYNRLAIKYSECWSNDTCMHSRLYKFLEYIPEKGPVVDIGSGTGRDVRFLLDKGIYTIGIDISIEMIKEAKKICPKGEFILMDMRNLGLPSDLFYGIWACASVIHIPKLEINTILSEFYRILKYGGALFLSMQKKDQKGEDEIFIPDGRFYAYYTRHEIEDILQKNGFKILYHDYNENSKNTFNRSIVVKWINFWAKKI